MSLIDNKITSFTKKIADLPTKPNASQGLTAQQLKQYYDSSPEELKVALNGLIDELLSTNCAGQIGINSLYGSTVESVINYIIGLGSGALPPANTITLDMQHPNVKTGLLSGLNTTSKTNFVGAINELVAKDTTLTNSINAIPASLESSYVKKGGTSTIKYYVNPTGSDSNDGLTVGTPFKTPAKALSMLPEYFTGNNDSHMIYLSAGTYPSSYVFLRGLHGNGQVGIFGAGATTILNSIGADDCNIMLTIGNLKADYYGISSSSHIMLSQLTCANRTINFQDSEGYVSTCSFNGASPCIYANRNSHVAVSSNSGSGNTKVLESSWCSTIVKNGAIGITGTTLETVSSGGVIR